ncbi:MAG: hypothetical protein MUD14_24115 [Hydrococcus sp. Prado102]|nr:hypothetical protein [Hydrococcus sp. Prado102]
MTKATLVQPPQSSSTLPVISYEVAMSQPTSHLFEVTLWVKNWQSSTLDLKMPVWTPGSYLVREYARHVQDFVAKSSDCKQKLKSRKIAKNYWQIETENCSEIQISYRVFANELTVRTNHLDATHGYFNGAALFFFIPGLEKQPIEVAIVPPKKDWKAITSLPVVSGKNNTFQAQDFDTLVDSPFEIGIHRLYDFEVLGKPQSVWWIAL